MFKLFDVKYIFPASLPLLSPKPPPPQKPPSQPLIFLSFRVPTSSGSVCKARPPLCVHTPPPLPLPLSPAAIGWPTRPSTISPPLIGRPRCPSKALLLPDWSGRLSIRTPPLPVPQRKRRIPIGRTSCRWSRLHLSQWQPLLSIQAITRSDWPVRPSIISPSLSLVAPLCCWSRPRPLSLAAPAVNPSHPCLCWPDRPSINFPSLSHWPPRTAAGPAPFRQSPPPPPLIGRRLLSIQAIPLSDWPGRPSITGHWAVLSRNRLPIGRTSFWPRSSLTAKHQWNAVGGGIPRLPALPFVQPSCQSSQLTNGHGAIVTQWGARQGRFSLDVGAAHQSRSAGPPPPPPLRQLVGQDCCLSAGLSQWKAEEETFQPAYHRPIGRCCSEMLANGCRALTLPPSSEADWPGRHVSQAAPAPVSRPLG